MKYYITTFGCQMNKSDSERIAAILEKQGYKPVKTDSSTEALAEADLVLVNMCSVRQSAVDRVYGLAKKFQKLKQKNPKLKTILTGCILGSDKIKFKKIFNEILPKEKFLKEVLPKRAGYRVLIPISDGCNFKCTYCVIPFTRGTLVCRNHQEILQEIKEVLKSGFKEIWLLGQIVNDYLSPADPSINFAKLLQMVDNLSGDFRIYFTSPHPEKFTDELIEVIANSKKIGHYLNLPVQSGDDEILKRMARPYTVQEYKNLVQKIRKKIPDIALSTDVIVGFCGETEQQFENTAKLLKEIRFDMAYIAQYSERPGTFAARCLKDNVPHQEKERREKILTKILKKTALENNKKYIGKIVRVIPEESKGGFLIGKTDHYKTIKFKGTENLIGQFVKVKVSQVISWGLKGQIV